MVERSEPVAGQDVELTIDMELQEFVLAALREAVEGTETTPGVPYASGASAVVLDVATREVLALVSYPAYSYERFDEDYDGLVRDARRTPLRFRAVSGLYPPGSTCKAITLVGAAERGRDDAGGRIHCTGHLLRSWRISSAAGFQRLSHDATPAAEGQREDAIGTRATSISTSWAGGSGRSAVQLVQHLRARPVAGDGADRGSAGRLADRALAARQSAARVRAL